MQKSNHGLNNQLLTLVIRSVRRNVSLIPLRELLGKREILLPIKPYRNCGDARCLMVIVVGNGHGETSSNLGRD